MCRALLVLVLAVAACASRPPYASGYLGDYSDLRQSASDPDLWEWRHPGADFRVYDKLVVEPVLIRLADGSSAKGLGDQAIRKTAEELQAALVAGAAPRWKVVPRGGPGALRMQVVLVDVMPGAVAYEAEVVDTVTASRLVKLVRKVPWPSASATIAPF
ncbi:MAG TPA: DUF3313 family protein [Planctomycetota bacterium]|nr:DUF3313 family protein [Planctomycetota bacterium]